MVCLIPLLIILLAIIFLLLIRNFLAVTFVDVKPKNFREAIQDPKRREAMVEEIEALESTRTWNLEDLPPDKILIGCKWVYRIKYNPDDTIEYFKTHLVMLGNTQVEGLDYTKNIAPVGICSMFRIYGYS